MIRFFKWLGRMFVKAFEAYARSQEPYQPRREEQDSRMGMFDGFEQTYDPRADVDLIGIPYTKKPEK